MMHVGGTTEIMTQWCQIFLFNKSLFYCSVNSHINHIISTHFYIHVHLALSQGPSPQCKCCNVFGVSSGSSISLVSYIDLTFTFSHLADALIQSDIQ